LVTTLPACQCGPRSGALIPLRTRNHHSPLFSPLPSLSFLSSLSLPSLLPYLLPSFFSYFLFILSAPFSFPLPVPARGLGESRELPSGVWGRAPTEIEFGAF